MKMGQWLLPPGDDRTDQSKRGAISGDVRVRSIADSMKLYIRVCDLSLSSIHSLSLITIFTALPLLFVFLHSHKTLWLLKSIIM